jgi:hypothetical protein
VPLVAAVRTVPVAETRYVEVGGKAHPADKVALRFSYEDVGD